MSIEYPPCKFHDAEGMFESFVCSVWINKVRVSQLVYVA